MIYNHAHTEIYLTQIACRRILSEFKQEVQLKTRLVTIHTGARIRVPTHIQRIDTGSTHGWQVRYHEQTLFSDGRGAGNGPLPALKRAINELHRRINRMPAPIGLRRDISPNKQNNLPLGISGPILRQRPGLSVPECNFSVSLPRFGGKAQHCSVYIANQNTYTQERYTRALAKAITLRQKAEAAYQDAATMAKRLSVTKL